VSKTKLREKGEGRKEKEKETGSSSITWWVSPINAKGVIYK